MPVASFSVNKIRAAPAGLARAQSFKNSVCSLFGQVRSSVLRDRLGYKLCSGNPRLTLSTKCPLDRYCRMRNQKSPSGLMQMSRNNLDCATS